MKRLFIDVETGGIDPNIHSLLTVGLVVADGEKIVDRLELGIKHKTFNVTQEAMKVNNIDLKDLTTSPEDSFLIIDAFLKRNFDRKINIGGHNIGFDISFFKPFYESVREYLKSLNPNIDIPTWNQRFDYHYVDTSIIATYLKECGKLKVSSVSLGKLIEYFNLQAESRHTAMEDAMMSALVYHRLKKLI